MHCIDASHIFLYTLIILSGNSFLLSRSQEDTSQNYFFESWNVSQCVFGPSDEFEELQHFKNTTDFILKQVQMMRKADNVENTTVPYAPINYPTKRYKYVLTEQSFKRLRRSSIHFNKIRGNFDNTTEIALSLDSALILNVNITPLEDPTRLVKRISFTLKNVAFSITKNISQSSNESSTAPKLITFDYITSVKNYELVDPEPPTDKLIAKIKQLIRSAFIHKFSKNTEQNLMANFTQHYSKMLWEIFCTSRNDGYNIPHYMKEFPNITNHSTNWQMTNVSIINHWPRLKSINIIYLHNFSIIHFELGNSSIRLQADFNNSAIKIENGYKIDQILITLTAKRTELRKGTIQFIGFKSTDHANSNLPDNIVKAALEISMEKAMWNIQPLNCTEICTRYQDSD